MNIDMDMLTPILALRSGIWSGWSLAAYSVSESQGRRTKRH